MKTLLPVALLLAVLGGCATPQYQTVVRLIPPQDAQGRACVQQCEVRKTACQDQCKARYDACAQGVEAQVQPRYEAQLKAYELELRRYAAALRHYEMQLQFDWMFSYPHRYSYWWDPWPGPYFPPPYREPVMPMREGVRAQLLKSSCQDDCGCLPAYDDCFVGCGGIKESETVCVKNCPPGQR